MNLPHSRGRHGAIRRAQDRPELYTVANVVALIPHLSVTLFSLLYGTAVPPPFREGPFRWRSIKTRIIRSPDRGKP